MEAVLLLSPAANAELRAHAGNHRTPLVEQCTYAKRLCKDLRIRPRGVIMRRVGAQLIRAHGRPKARG